MQNDCMKTTTCTIRNVPLRLRDKLAARAAAQGQSLQDYLLQLLSEHGARPTASDLAQRIRAQKAAMSSTVTTTAILRALDEGRR